MIPNLVNLESHVIRDRETATLRYQGDVFRAEGKEDQERIDREERQKIADSEREHKAAFVESVLGKVLIKQLSLKNHGAEFELSRR